jgi:hypothetical protein
MTRDRTPFYEDDEDPDVLWALYDEAKVRGDVVYTAPPDVALEQAQVTTVEANYIAVTAPLRHAEYGLYGDLGRLALGGRAGTSSTSARGTVQ